MSEAKYGKTMMSSIVPVFRFAHTGYLLRTYTFNRTLYRMITCNLSLYHGALRNPSA
ncbi:hypothetical protein CbuD7D7780_06180 [Coxiella burnetii]|nr:hypothetical protein [Coxiella burnetii]OYK80138.1 hypothetical protein CbuD7E6568_06155 [Coxiella burnetii]OYK82220.1 hypothetical protein CbuD7D7780_06180 [Coxiella burnetii]OYK86347.1 hypothetical protein CbuQ229_04515 [Coxiella burnetii]PHH56664.1 hypothetical protein CRH12_09695 [Coxiella burnetii]UYK68913.1 hypothetical protein OHM78_05590 [Coxiella burnetii]